MNHTRIFTDEHEFQIYGCENSGLFKAFGDHVLHRLRIPLHERKNQRIRITLLSRDTQYRKILNEDELVNALKENPEYKVRKVKNGAMEWS